MASTPPLAFKKISVFLRRAEEIQSDFPIVAYNCRQYYLQEALEIQKMMTPAEKKTATKHIIELMDQLEKDKAIVSKLPDFEKAAVHHLEFALQVFNGADVQDREGVANQSTMSAFLAASQFFEALQIFAPLLEQIADKKKYAKWRAAEIAKALKSGVAPPPPPAQEPQQNHFDAPANEYGQTMSHSTTNTAPLQQSSAQSVGQSCADPTVQDLERELEMLMKGGSVSQVTPTIQHQAPSQVPRVNPLAPQPQPQPQPQIQQATPAQQQVPPANANTTAKPYTPTAADITNAERNAKYAISSLQFNDVPAAINFLETALQALRTGKK